MGNTGRGLGMALLVALCLQAFLVSSTFATTRVYNWVLQETNITKLCGTQQVVTVNGMYPGPTITVRDGDTVIVNVVNKCNYNATIHWHGVYQLRTGWSDGPEYITQCPIQPGANYTYKFNINGQHGTLWWHAHFSWLRATVFGPFIILPPSNFVYPYQKPQHEETLMLGEWWNANPMDVIRRALQDGGVPQNHDSLVINGEPGDQKPCSNSTKIKVKKGESVQLRLINVAMNTVMFAGLANHSLTVVAADARYTKPYNTSYVVVDPGQTLDVVFTADQACGSYYFATRVWRAGPGLPIDMISTSTIFEYDCPATNSTTASPTLPDYTDSGAVETFHSSLRGLNTSDVPTNLDENMLITVSLNVLPCDLGPNTTCAGPSGNRFATSLNNVSFQFPNVSILNAYYFNISGVYTSDFPDRPPVEFNYTDINIPQSSSFTTRGTRVKKLQYNSTVQIVLQGTGVAGGESHPIHLHGHDFYVVGRGSGNFNATTDTANFNLADPMARNTVNLPANGWTALRFVSNNPGVWLMHCHLDFHLSVGMGTVFITENGQGQAAKLEPPPADLPKCRA